MIMLLANRACAPRPNPMLAEHGGCPPPAFLKPSMVMVKVHAIAMLAQGRVRENYADYYD